MLTEKNKNSMYELIELIRHASLFQARFAKRVALFILFVFKLVRHKEKEPELIKLVLNAERRIHTIELQRIYKRYGKYL